MRKSRLSQYKQDRLNEHFVVGSTAIDFICAIATISRRSLSCEFCRKMLALVTSR